MVSQSRSAAGLGILASSCARNTIVLSFACRSFAQAGLDTK